MSRQRSATRSADAHQPEELPELLADNNIDQAAIEALREMGFVVHDAKVEFPEGTSDRVLANAAEARGWIVVTNDRGDFKKMLNRARRTHEQKQYYRAGALYVKTKKLRHLPQRVRQLRSTLFCEIANAERRKDRRVFLEILDGQVNIIR